MSDLQAPKEVQQRRSSHQINLIACSGLRTKSNRSLSSRPSKQSESIDNKHHKNDDYLIESKDGNRMKAFNNIPRTPRQNSSSQIPEKKPPRSNSQSAQKQNSQAQTNESILNDFLPASIRGIQIRKLDWNDFPSDPDPSMPYSAHVYWHVNYSYTTTSNAGVVRVRTVTVNVNVSNKSWVKKKSDWLLSHEQGHYLIGCLCALEFKKQVLNTSFTTMYDSEIAQIFKRILKQFTQMEIQYDEETHHALDSAVQEKWYFDLFQKLKKHQYAIQRRSSIEDKENAPPVSNRIPKYGQLPPIPKNQLIK